MDHCRVCAHPSAKAISADLLARIPYRTIAATHGVSITALSRHVNEHIPESLRRQATKERYQPDAETVLMQMRKLNQRSLAILRDAEAAKDRGLALNAIKECRRNLELIAKLTGELDPRAGAESASGQVNVVVTYVDRPQIAVNPTAPMLEAGE